MVDIPGNSSTTATLTVGGSATDMLEFKGDHDWFRIELTAGQQISISVTGVGATALEDPCVYLIGPNGNVVAENDDSGGSRNSRLVFTVTRSGTYYIDVAAWNED